MKEKSFWLRLLLSGGLIYLLLYTVDFQESFTILRRSNLSYLLIAILIAFCDRILMAYKWNILLKAQGIKISLPSITGVYLSTTFLGLFLPATVGADALRAYTVSKENHSTSSVISSIIVERALGFIALFIFLLVGIISSLFVFGQSFFAGIWHLFWLFFALFAISSTLFLLTLNKSILGHLKLWSKSWNTKFHNHGLMKKLVEVYRSYQNYRDKKVSLITFFLLSWVENLFPLFWTYFLSLAFDIDIPLLYFFILIPIVLVLVRLPISLDGFGIQEGAFVYFLALIGVTKAEALLLGVVSHIIAILSVLPGGLLYSYNGLGFRGSRKDQGETISMIPNEKIEVHQIADS